MASGRIPASPPLAGHTAVRSGKSVRGATLSSVALANNYALGMGGTLLPFFNPQSTIAFGATNTYRFKVWPHIQAWDRIAALRLDGGAGVRNAADVTVGGASPVSVTASNLTNAPSIVLTEALSSRTASVDDFALVIDNTGEDDLYLRGFGLYEMPRAALVCDGTEYGVDVETCRAGATIFDGTGRSMGGIVDSVGQLSSVVRRNGMFAWATDIANAPMTVTSSGIIFLVGAPMLGHKSLVADTVRTVTVYVYAQTSSNATQGTIDLAMTSGDTAQISIPTGSHLAAAWFSATIDVHAEDLTASDGRRSSTTDLLTFTWSKGAGANLLLGSVCVGTA